MPLKREKTTVQTSKKTLKYLKTVSAIDGIATLDEEIYILARKRLLVLLGSAKSNEIFIKLDQK